MVRPQISIIRRRFETDYSACFFQSNKIITGIPFVGHIFTPSIIQQQVDSSRFLINAAILFNTNTCYHRRGGGGGGILENF